MEERDRRNFITPLQNIGIIFEMKISCRNLQKKWKISLFCCNHAIIVFYVTRINNTRFVLNCDLIQTVEETPDTVITLTTGAKYVVKESCEEIKKKGLEYKRSIISVLNENM